MRQKSQKTDKNQGGEQKTQWDSNSGGRSGKGKEGDGGEGQPFRVWDPTSSGHIYNRKDKGGCCWWWWWSGRGFSSGVGFICIDPQDSNREQLRDRRGMEHKVWAYYIRCCLRGNVVLVITVCQGKQTNKTTRHVKISRGWVQRVNSRGLKSMKCILKNPEASVDFHVTSHSGDEECVRSKPMVVTWCEAREGQAVNGEGRLWKGRGGRTDTTFHSREQFGLQSVFDWSLEATSWTDLASSAVILVYR